MTRLEELAAIARFLVTSGATRCPSRFAAPTMTSASLEEQAQRLLQLQIKEVDRISFMRAQLAVWFGRRPRPR